MFFLVWNELADMKYGSAECFDQQRALKEQYLKINYCQAKFDTIHYFWEAPNNTAGLLLRNANASNNNKYEKCLLL